jgi:hypothetical protein
MDDLNTALSVSASGMRAPSAAAGRRQSFGFARA